LTGYVPDRTLATYAQRHIDLWARTQQTTTQKTTVGKGMASKQFEPDPYFYPRCVGCKKALTNMEIGSSHPRHCSACWNDAAPKAEQKFDPAKFEKDLAEASKKLGFIQKIEQPAFEKQVVTPHLGGMVPSLGNILENLFETGVEADLLYVAPPDAKPEFPNHAPITSLLPTAASEEEKKALTEAIQKAVKHFHKGDSKAVCEAAKCVVTMIKELVDCPQCKRWLWEEEKRPKTRWELLDLD
jgi:hypothetical protein